MPGHTAPYIYIYGIVSRRDVARRDFSLALCKKRGFRENDRGEDSSGVFVKYTVAGVALMMAGLVVGSKAVDVVGHYVNEEANL